LGNEDRTISEVPANRYFSQKFGNASRLHSIGQEAKEALEESREKVACLLNADQEEIVFTSVGRSRTTWPSRA